MRGTQNFQGAPFSYITLEERVPTTPCANCARWWTHSWPAGQRNSKRCPPAAAAPRSCCSRPCCCKSSIRSERLLLEAIDYNLLYRRYRGLNIEDKVWDHSTFSANRQRLFNEDLARVFFERVKHTADWVSPTSDEHFRVDGPLIEAWASHKRFKRKDDGARLRLRGIPLPVAAKAQHPAIAGRTQRHPGYERSLRMRKRIEEALGWIDRRRSGQDQTHWARQVGRAGAAVLCRVQAGAHAALLAGGTRIMWERGPHCARNGRDGLKRALRRASKAGKCALKCALSRRKTGAHGK